MPFTMSQSSLPVFEIGLNALSAVLDKAAAFAAAKKVDPAVLLGWRLAPDMFALARQVQTACDQAKNGSARVWPASSRRNSRTTKPASINSRSASPRPWLFSRRSTARRSTPQPTSEITFPLGPNKGQMKGGDYLNHFVLPNFYFHLTAAYAIVRHCGVEIGKRDFLGAIPLKRI